LSDLETGKRKIAQMGNAQLDTKWRLRNLPVGKYYWRVQSIDQAFIGSEWTPVDSFIVTTVNTFFSIQNPIVCLGDTIIFSDNSITTNTIIGWKWLFGDGTWSSEQHPTHLYQKADTFDVTLITYSEFGDSASLTKPVIVKPVPVASFTVEPVCLGTKSMLINNSDTSTIEVQNWLWDFGNGEISESRTSVSQIYTESDTVILRIQASNNCWDADTQIVLIAEYPISSISLDDGVPRFCENDSGTISINSFNPDFTYQWLESGSPFIADNTEEINIKSSGNYAVTAINPIAGCTDTSNTIQINVFSSPNPLLIENVTGSTMICMGDSVQLRASEAIETYLLEWTNEIGGLVGNNQNIWIKNKGSYKIRARFKDLEVECWSDDSEEVQIEVASAVQQRDITMTSDTIKCFGDSVTLKIDYPEEYSIQWFRNSVPISGANRLSYIARLKGKYMVEIISPNACRNVSANTINLSFDSIPETPEIALLNSLNCSYDQVKLKINNYSENWKYQWLKNDSYFADAEIDTLSKILEQAEYSVLAFNKNNVECTSLSAPINIDFNSDLEKPALTIFGPGEWHIECSISNAHDYHWYYNGDLIEEEDDHIYMVDQSNGDYHVLISDETGCWVSSDTVSLYLFTSTQENLRESSSDLMFYPNPSYGNFSLELNNTYKGEISYQCYNMLGKLVLSGRLTKTTNTFIKEFDTINLLKGIYYFNVQMGKNRIIKEILIQ
jgi:PKD repeat protein